MESSLQNNSTISFIALAQVKFQNIVLQANIIWILTNTDFNDWYWYPAGYGAPLIPQKKLRIQTRPEAIFLVVCDPSMNELWAT